jgi:hypothetical protein
VALNLDAPDSDVRTFRELLLNNIGVFKRGNKPRTNATSQGHRTGVPLVKQSSELKIRGKNLTR